MGTHWQQGRLRNTGQFPTHRGLLRKQQKTEKGTVDESSVMLAIRKQYQKRGGPALSLPHLSPMWLQLSGLAPFPRNSLLPSQVTRTPANLLSKSHLYLQTVLSDPNLRRGRERKGGEGREATDTETVPLTCTPPAPAFSGPCPNRGWYLEGHFP